MKFIAALSLGFLLFLSLDVFAACGDRLADSFYPGWKALIVNLKRNVGDECPEESRIQRLRTLLPWLKNTQLLRRLIARTVSEILIQKRKLDLLSAKEIDQLQSLIDEAARAGDELEGNDISPRDQLLAWSSFFSQAEFPQQRISRSLTEAHVIKIERLRRVIAKIRNPYVVLTLVDSVAFQLIDDFVQTQESPHKSVLADMLQLTKEAQLAIEAPSFAPMQGKYFRRKTSKPEGWLQFLKVNGIFIEDKQDAVAEETLRRARLLLSVSKNLNPQFLDGLVNSVMQGYVSGPKMLTGIGAGEMDQLMGLLEDVVQISASSRAPIHENDYFDGWIEILKRAKQRDSRKPSDGAMERYRQLQKSLGGKEFERSFIAAILHAYRDRILSMSLGSTESEQLSLLVMEAKEAQDLNLEEAESASTD